MLRPDFGCLRSRPQESILSRGRRQRGPISKPVLSPVEGGAAPLIPPTKGGPRVPLARALSPGSDGGQMLWSKGLYLTTGKIGGILLS